MTYLHGHANIGYGAAHNLVLHGTGSDYHLVLNPDVELAPDALANGIGWLDRHPDVGALAPLPSTRAAHPPTCASAIPASSISSCGALPGIHARLFRQRLDRYELRDVLAAADGKDVVGIPVLSGAFMLVKRSAIDRTGGFDPSYFLYFEDFDWSVRLNKMTKTAYVPSVQIGHHGGHAARKGMKHIGLFARSAVRFYRRHGWKWF